MEVAAILSAIAGLACCGTMAVIILGVVVFLVRRSRQSAESGDAAASSALPDSPEAIVPEAAVPDASSKGFSAAPVAPAEPLAPAEPVAVPAEPPAADGSFEPASVGSEAPELPPIAESDEDPTEPEQDGAENAPTLDSEPVPADPSAWTTSPGGASPPDPSGLAGALRPGVTIVPDEAMLEELEGDETVLMPRIPRQTLDDEDE